MSNEEKKEPGQSGPDALQVLRDDHARVKRLFDEFAQLTESDDEDDQRISELVDDICYELTVHAMIEEELFYPAVRSMTDDEDILDEADVEHAGARELVSQLEVMYPGDDHFDATVTVLGEEVAHHIEKEETTIFAAARASGLDLQRLGQQLAARRRELEEDLTSPPASPDVMEPRAASRQPPRVPD